LCAWLLRSPSFGRVGGALPRENVKISAIIPAYNEAENIALVVGGLRELRDATGEPLIHEVVVADNDSTDETAALAAQAGARVIAVPARGYGNACAAACAAAQGDVYLFVDGDHTADLSQSAMLIAAIAQGDDLAIGVRANARRGSLTLPQKFGNALACFLIRCIWRVPVTDLGPFRAIRRDAYERIGMRDRTYGWTVEMQVRAAQLRLRTVELPVTWLPRHAGTSKVSGTVRGVFGAGVGILSMIAKLWWRGRAEEKMNSSFLRSRPPAETDCV
jgi:glycosyltransferase involved in cell wall biosynthesis